MRLGEARAVTTESGRRSFGGFTTDVIRVDSTATATIDPWKTKVEVSKTMTVGDLSSVLKYNLLATHIIDSGVNLHTKIKVCIKPPHLKHVETKSRVYRDINDVIHTKLIGV